METRHDFVIMKLTRILFIAAALAATLAPCRSEEESMRSDLSSEVKVPSIDELLLFFPSKFPVGDWDPEGLQFQDVFFIADDGTKLHGWYCPVDRPRAVVLAAHGNAGHVAFRAPWLRYLQSTAKVSVFMFDYRGYGRSEGVATVAGAIQDATAAREKLCELADVTESDMILMGESLGGAIVVQLAAKSPPRGLILQTWLGWFRRKSWTQPHRSPVIAAHCYKATETAIGQFPFHPVKSFSELQMNQSNSSQLLMRITTTG